jgi:hypothetical protein
LGWWPGGGGKGRGAPRKIQARKDQRETGGENGGGSQTIYSLLEKTHKTQHYLVVSFH